MDLEPGRQIGRYRIISRLGQGGMSNVFRAQDTQEGRDVVLKFPHQELLGDVASHERFQREVKIGQRLHHPHIQQLYELAYDGGNEFIVLEFVPGTSLRRYLADRKHPNGEDDIRLAVDLGSQIGGALAHAHANHVWHRDLKPENIIVDEYGNAKVMDFGIALLQGSRRVTWGPLSNQVGTPDYMSPEQIQGGRGDARTDVYALGMILYEIVAGRGPYQGDNPLAIMNQHVNKKAPPIHQFRKDVPPALEEVVMKAIRLKPDDRWQTMNDFVVALQNWENADVDALKAEREAEADSGKAAHAVGKLPIPLNPTTLWVAVGVVIFVAVVTVVFALVKSLPH